MKKNFKKEVSYAKKLAVNTRVEVMKCCKFWGSVGSGVVGVLWWTFFLALVWGIHEFREWVRHKQFVEGGYPLYDSRRLWDFFVIPMVYVGISMLGIWVTTWSIQVFGRLVEGPKSFENDHLDTLLISGQIALTGMILWLTIGLHPLHYLKEILHEDLISLVRKDWLLQVPAFSLGTFAVLAFIPREPLMRLLRRLNVSCQSLAYGISLATISVVLVGHYFIVGYVYSDGGLIRDVVDGYAEDLDDIEFFEHIWIPVSASYIRCVENHRHRNASHSAAWLHWWFQEKYRHRLSEVENLGALKDNITILEKFADEHDLDRLNGASTIKQLAKDLRKEPYL